MGLRGLVESALMRCAHQTYTDARFTLSALSAVIGIHLRLDRSRGLYTRPCAPILRENSCSKLLRTLLYLQSCLRTS